MELLSKRLSGRSRKARVDPVTPEQLVGRPPQNGARVLIDEGNPSSSVQREQDDGSRVQVSLRPVSLIAQGRLREAFALQQLGRAQANFAFKHLAVPVEIVT